jgi:aminopeptidase N
MPTHNVSLTRGEAEARAALISDCHYRLQLDLALGRDRYGYRVELEFSGEPGATTFLDAQVDQVAGMTWQGEELSREAWREQRIHLPVLAERNRVEVWGTSSYHRTGLGIHLAVDPADSEAYVYTDLEPADAHRVFPCFDQPDIKGVFEIAVRVPQDWTVVSAEPGRAGKASDDEGARWWEFAPTRRLAPYVLGIAAGRLHAIRSQHGQIPLGLFAPLSLGQDLEKAAEEIFEITGQGLDFYQERFGVPYPYRKYDQVFCLEKVNGAMESPGCVTITDRMIYRGRPSARESSQRAEVILHEMAHMWFGDLVTFRWWDDLWLNESFATFMSAVAEDRATRFDDSWTFWATYFKQLAVEEDQHSTSHPVVTEVPDSEAVHLNFDRITYQKGAAVIRQLATWVGEAAFFSAIHHHLVAHSEGNATLGDLLGALERASGRDVQGWSRAWLETTGLNTIRLEVEEVRGAEGQLVQEAALVQTATAAQPTIRPHRLGVGEFRWRDRKLVLERRHEVELQGDRTGIPELRGRLRPPLLLPNDESVTYAKVRLDPVSLRTVEASLARISDPLARAVIWDLLWDMVRDGELPTCRYVGTVVANLPDETDQSLVPVALGQARQAIARFGAPAHGDELEASLADAAAKALERTEPGGLDQLTWLRALVVSATTPAQLARVESMLRGDGLPPGAVLDLEMRWRLVTALAARGVLGEKDVARMQRADSTATGQVRALAARAAIPSPEAKEAVFRHMTEDDSANVEEAIWVGRSFAGVRRPDLLLPFVPRFFAAIDSLRQSRGSEYSRDFAYWFMPALPAEPQLVAEVRGQLAREDLAPDLRRIYQDSLEEAELALRARAVDEGAYSGG